MRRRAALALLFLFGLVAPFATAGDDDERHPVEFLFDAPPATGILVASVAMESAADDAGLSIGDIVVSYGGIATPTGAALAAAIEKSGGRESGDAKSVKIGVFRGGDVVEVVIATGQMGIHGVPITEGKPLPALPPATAVTFDFSALDDAPRDEWFAFSIGGPKIGYEHSRLTKAGERLVLVREVAFEGRPYGRNHHVVRVTFRAGAFPAVDEVRYRDSVRDWTGVGHRQVEFGETSWRFSGEGHDATLNGEDGLPTRALPSYLVGPIATFLPREKGACIHFRPIGETNGEVGFTTALVCVGREASEGGKATWRFDWVDRGGGVRSSFWIDDAGRTIRESYGGARAVRTDRAKALEGIGEGLRPTAR